MTDWQRETFGRVAAELRFFDGSCVKGSVESLNKNGLPPDVLIVADKVFVRKGPDFPGVRIFEEKVIGWWENGPAICSARESGGFRCTHPANHKGNHGWE